ncbi:MAG: dTDP-4-dehydrorhamnose reductase [Burkholderiaceae bacterium]
MNLVRPLVLGASGQVGEALCRLCQSQSFPVLGLTREQAPLDNLTGLRTALTEHIQSFRPAQIINAAAYTAVDRAESEPDLAHRVNAQAVGLIGEIAAAHGLPVVHYSTDYVFDGQKPVGQAYMPDDAVNPQSVYGRTKHAGEDQLLRSGAQALIFRTSWVFSDHGANFLKTMLRLAQEREALKVVADQHGAPTSAAFIAQSTLDILARWPVTAPPHQTRTAKQERSDTSSPPQSHEQRARVYHLTAAGQTTWHAFACALIAQARALRLDLPWKILADSQIQPITTAEYNAPAARPQNSLLDCSSTEGDFGLTRSTWQSQMQAVLEKLL